MLEHQKTLRKEGIVTVKEVKLTKLDFMRSGYGKLGGWASREA